eukprot:365554-Chlamydomonas_euryale.AAC.36
MLRGASARRRRQLPLVRRELVDVPGHAARTARACQTARERCRRPQIGRITAAVADVAVGRASCGCRAAERDAVRGGRTGRVAAAVAGLVIRRSGEREAAKRRAQASTAACAAMRSVSLRKQARTWRSCRDVQNACMHGMQP